MTESLKACLGKKISQLRLQHNLSRQQLADLAGFKLIGLSQIERGKKFVSEKTLQKFARIFNCSVRDLFSFDITPALTEENRKKLTDINNLLENHPDLISQTLEYLFNKIK